MQQSILRKLTLFITLCLIFAFSVKAQTTPEIGRNYYIAAQTWDGTKYVERFLNLVGTAVYQTTDVAQASVWSATKPANGSGIALSARSTAGTKYLMRGGISSASWGNIIAEPTITISDPPAGSLTIKSTVTNYQYYIISPNAGTGFTAVNAASEASYQPKTSLYTPYYKFYDASNPMVAVNEKLLDGTSMAIGASYVFIPKGKAPVGGNLWPIEEGTITIEASSYNHLFYTFVGFKVGNSTDIVQSVSTDGLTANTTISAVFTTNNLDGQKFTFISSCPSWYTNQKVYKAIYLDQADNKLKWKTYDPTDDAFYFEAHGQFDNLTFESVLSPGSYITGAVSPVGADGARVELRPLGAGDYSIVANSQNLYAYGHNNGRNVSGTLSDASGTSGSEAAWWIQNANDKSAEAARYQQALDREAALVAEGERQNARNTLLQAIKNVVVGDNMGNVPIDAYDLAVSTYENNTLSAEDYTNAITLLYSSCHVPALGTKWRIINSTNSGQVASVGVNDGLLKLSKRPSLYQVWIVDAINPEDPNQLALRNLGSGTYMSCSTTSSSTPTVTTDVFSYVNLNATAPGVFSIEIIGRADQYIYLYGGAQGPAIIVNTSGAWRFEEVSPIELDQLSAEADSLRAKRQELLDLITDVKRLSTIDKGIGYYSSLVSAVATAQSVYDDPTRLISEYQTGINNLKTAVSNAQYNLPNGDDTYIICDHDGRIAMQHVANTATLTTFDDTDQEYFWKLAANPRTDDDLLPWTQHYTLTSIEGENTVLTITARLIGNDEYYITIDGDEAWNAANGQTPLSIHKADLGTHHGYLTDGNIYRIRNAATGKVLTRSELWTARVSVETPDNTLTDWNQLWRVEKQAGADRYQLHNVESNRHIEEQLRVGQQLVAAFTPGTWHLVPAAQDGQYKLLTTMAPIDQLAIGYNGDKAVTVAQDAAGTAWIFERVTPVEKPNPDRQVYMLINRYYTTGTVTDYLYTNNSWVGHTSGRGGSGYNNDVYKKWTLAERDSVSSDGSPVFDANGNKIRLVDIQSGYCSKYIVPQNLANPFNVKTSPYSYQLLEYTDATTGETYKVFKNPTANQYLAINTNIGSYDRLAWVSDISNKAAHWSLQEVEGEIMNDEALLDRNDSMFGYRKPADGAVVRIVTSNEETCLDEYYKQNILQHKEINDKRYAQLWRLHQNPVTGLYKFENVYTGNYIVNSAAANNTLTTTVDESQAGEFAIALNKNVTATRQYNILDANLGFGMSAANTNIAANGIPTDRDEVTTSEFRMKIAADRNGTPYTEDNFLTMRRKFEENRDLMKYVTKYDDILRKLFVDRAYTTLRPDLTEEDIEEALDNLPDILFDMVNKIYKNEWPEYRSGTNWDKMFRIREYPVVSSANFGGVLRCAYNFSSMNEPTGILAHSGDVIAIMVSDAPKSGLVTLSLEMVEGLNRTGTRVALQQGLNFVQVTEDCNLFIFYMINRADDKPEYYLSNFPDMKIHIEGGEVYGCINRVHGPGKTVAEADELWVRMQQDGLIKNGPMSQVVGESIMLNFNSWDMLQGCPVKVGEVIDIWDSWIKIQQWIMGIRDREGNVINDYVPHLKERFNNRWSAFERTGGYMNANGGGAQYTTSAVQGIVNYNTLINGGGAWGPVHEHGHDHQTAINMCGMTEVSNNLFSNVCTREFGAIVSRGSSLPDAGNVYARGGNWFDNNIWVMTQMYYKLYLYYHVAGNKPTFYPEVFTKLRANPLLHNASVAVPADRDYLQFAKVCCEVAGEDLSEFFEAYGMLRPLTPEYSTAGESAYEDFKGQYCRIVGDYSTYHVYTTDQMLADAKAYMQSCGPKNGNIMFIDDRIRQEPAAHPAAKEGQMRANRGDGGTVGAYGNVGMWDDFTPEKQKVYAEDYSITKEWSAKGVTLHISGEGAIGYKIYGPNGELVYFSAFNDILLPAQILNKYDISDLVVVVAQADGTSVEITSDEDIKYALTTYRNGSSEGITSSSTGRFEPELKGNDVCVVEAVADLSLDDFAYQANDNVIMKDGSNYSMQQLTLKDMVSFYIPAEVSADAAAYERQNTTGWNSLCLPFAITESDFGTDAKIYTVKGVEDEDGSYVLYLQRKRQVEAGEPCFVLCEESESLWHIDIEATTAVADVAPASSADGSMRINGSFTNDVIGAGKYKLNADGTAFGVTSANGKVTAFRSYIETSGNRAPSFRLRVVDESIDGIDDVIIDRLLENGKIYDLNGRQLPAPIHGQPYILNGKVYYDR